MIAWLPLALLFAQAASSPEPASDPEPWPGTLAEGLDEIGRLSEAQKPAEALALAERLLAPDRFSRWRERAAAQPGWKKNLVLVADPIFAAVGLSGTERAAVHYARGVALSRTDDLGTAAEAFGKARALAGPGDLRLDSTYDAGWSALTEGERHREKIPEISGVPPQPPAAPQVAPLVPPAGQPAGQAVPPADPDPLQLARAAYQRARESFVERLKLDWKDADTRANAELVQRRLRELDAIERKREEEKKKEEEQKQDPKDPEQKKPEGEPQGEPKPDQQKPEDPAQPDPKAEPKPDEEHPQEPKAPDEQKDPEQAQAQPVAEEHLSKEEVMRLLDILKDREEEGKKLLEQLRRARRVSVKKDW